MTGDPLTSRSSTIHPRTNLRLRAVALGTVLALAASVVTTGAAFARTVFDGDWSVLIVTRSGSCDPSYRYGLKISDGNVTYDGGGLITMQGRVTPKGVVRVIVQGGGQWADGFGRLTRNQGSGIWRGQGASSACAGVWQAERRPPPG